MGKGINYDAHIVDDSVHDPRWAVGGDWRQAMILTIPVSITVDTDRHRFGFSLFETDGLSTRQLAVTSALEEMPWVLDCHVTPEPKPVMPIMDAVVICITGGVIGGVLFHLVTLLFGVK